MRAYDSTPKSSRIGIFGGAFDPIHYGHLINAETVRSDFNLDLVLFIPAKYTGRKGIEVLAPADDRYAMAVRAVEETGGFEVSRIELERDGPSYTIDTVDALRQQYPESTLYLIIGSDALDTIACWPGSARMLENVTPVVLRRPGHTFKAHGAVCRLSVAYADNPLLEISSSSIRSRIRAGKSIRFLVPDRVIEYIENKGLYSYTAR